MLLLSQHNGDKIWKKGKKTGVIYILKNPSFPQYVKNGYATDVNQRLDELNRSTAVPFAFRVYATYEVDSALSDKKLHSIFICYRKRI